MKNMHIRKRYKPKALALLATVNIAIILITGCGQFAAEKSKNDRFSLESAILIEQGEAIEKESSNFAVDKESIPEEPVVDNVPNIAEKQTPTVSPTPIIMEPEQEQVITEEDQTEPTERTLQLVFLGDSIFDNNRDGTGVPYLTSVQCDADVYNLAIAGTSATIEQGEKWNLEEF